MIDFLTMQKQKKRLCQCQSSSGSWEEERMRFFSLSLFTGSLMVGKLPVSVYILYIIISFGSFFVSSQTSPPMYLDL